MRTENEKDEQLIRWLEGELSGRELSAFEESTEFKDYKVIIDGVENITYPHMDEKSVFSNIQSKISAKQSSPKLASRIIPLRRWVLAVASIAILTLVVLAVIPKSMKITSGMGQFVAHTLPDGSEIDLNSNSRIDYRDNFEGNRILHLDGEAFFKVEKGKSFKVKTNEGIVSVLGTSFNIFARDDIFIVSCKTGKVKVDSKNQSYILQKGDRIKLENGKSLGKESINIAKIGNWVNGESYFLSASLDEVILSLSSIYDTDINLPLVHQNKRFTGSFIHNDLKKALKMVFSPMQITYSVDDQGKIDLGE